MKLNTFSAIGVLSLAAAFTPTASAQNAQFLVHDSSGLCVDVAGAPGLANGARIQLWACEASGKTGNGAASDHKWTHQNGFIRNAVSGKCIDVPGAPGTREGSKLNLYDCELSGRHPNGSQTDQQFDLVNGQFKHRLSGLCIGPEVTTYRNGVGLILARCAKPGAADLEFRFKPSVGAAAPAPAPAVAAAPKPGKPQLIYPDFPGASQTCVVPIDPATKRYKVAAGSELMLANCNAAQGRIFSVSPGRIGIASQPNLCVNVSAGAHQATLYLEDCKDAAVKKWEAAGTSTASARLRAVGGNWNDLCWAAPAIGNNNVRLPIPVNAVPCQGAKDQKFFIEAE